MELEQAQAILADCTAHTWFQLGLRETPPPDISKYSLSDMVEANEVVKKFNDVRTDRCQSIVMDDRLVAALYTLTHFHTSETEPVVLNKEKAVLVVKLPANFFDEQDQ